MKKFHINLVLFLSVLAIVVFVVEKRLANTLETHLTLKYNELIHPEVKAQVVVIGTSHSGFAINPEYLKLKDYKTYNFSMGGCPPTYYRIWYQHIFRKFYPKPKYLIYAVDWSMFDTVYMRRTFDVDSRLMPWSVIADVVIADEDLNRKYMLLNKLYLVSKPKNLEHLFFDKENKYVDLEKFKYGYAPREIAFKRGFKSMEKLGNSKHSKSNFNNLLDQIQHDGIKVIFVNIPEYMPGWQAEGIQENLHYIDSIAQARKIPYLKYNEDLITDINTDSTYFFDWIHFKEKGAEKFSKMLNKDLQNIIE